MQQFAHESDGAVFANAFDPLEQEDSRQTGHPLHLMDTAGGGVGVFPGLAGCAVHADGECHPPGIAAGFGEERFGFLICLFYSALITRVALIFLSSDRSDPPA